MVDADITSFIRNEAAINEKNNLVHFPSAGMLFCSSLDPNKVNTDLIQLKLNPTTKNVRFYLQSSKGSEATTSKANTKPFVPSFKLKNRNVFNRD
jgi:hypothetical protein